MPNILRTTSLPPLAELVSVPRIVIVDETGPAIPVGVSAGVALLLGEFVQGGFLPTEVTSGGELASLYGPAVYPYLSQGASGVQDGSGAAWNGNGMLQLANKSFKRLAILRVDNEAVTSDGGTTKAVITMTVTVAAADQAGGVTNKDITIPAGRRFGDAAIGLAVQVVASSGVVLIPKGTTVTSNQVTATCPVFIVKEPEPVVAINASAIDTVIDAFIDNVAPGTTITGVSNGTAIWPPGAGTTLAARIESRYVADMEKTLPAASPTQDVTVIWAARRSAAIRQALYDNAVQASKSGRARVAVLSADPATAGTVGAASTAKSAAAALATTESYAQPADRAIIAFPHVKIRSNDLGQIVVVSPDSFMACTLSNLSNERNPGQENAFIQSIVSLEDAFIVSPLQIQDYINLKAGGVCALQKDPTVGWWFNDGVTAANVTAYPTRAPIKRRRMADEIQDSLAGIATPYQKKPATTENVDSFVGALQAYLGGLKSVNQPALQRVQDFLIDPVGGNDPQLTALGIYTILVYVRLLPTMDVILFRTKIGETVEIPSSEAA